MTERERKQVQKILKKQKLLYCFWNVGFNIQLWNWAPQISSLVQMKDSSYSDYVVQCYSNIVEEIGLTKRNITGSSQVVQWLGLCAFTAKGPGFNLWLGKLRYCKSCGTVTHKK